MLWKERNNRIFNNVAEHMKPPWLTRSSASLITGVPQEFSESRGQREIDRS
jgi:hypothetical protein